MESSEVTQKCFLFHCGAWRFPTEIQQSFAVIYMPENKILSALRSKLACCIIQKPLAKTIYICQRMSCSHQHIFVLCFYLWDCCHGMSSVDRLWSPIPPKERGSSQGCKHFQAPRGCVTSPERPNDVMCWKTHSGITPSRGQLTEICVFFCILDSVSAVQAAGPKLLHKWEAPVPKPKPVFHVPCLYAPAMGCEFQVTWESFTEVWSNSGKSVGATSFGCEGWFESWFSTCLHGTSCLKITCRHSTAGNSSAESYLGSCVLLNGFTMCLPAQQAQRTHSIATKDERKVIVQTKYIALDLSVERSGFREQMMGIYEFCQDLYFGIKCISSILFFLFLLNRERDVTLGGSGQHIVIIFTLTVDIWVRLLPNITVYRANFFFFQPVIWQKRNVMSVEHLGDFLCKFISSRAVPVVWSQDTMCRLSDG